MENVYNAETGCCPRFDPAPWDKKDTTCPKCAKEYGKNYMVLVAQI